MRTMDTGAKLALSILWLAASSGASGQVAPGFLLGDWQVASDYVLPDGGTEQSSAAAAIGEETIAGATTWIRQTLAGTREGQEVEIGTTFALNPADGRWVMMQADSVAGTVDVASGGPTAAGDEWVFTSLAATRPDGGLDRYRYSDISGDGFTLTVSRTFDGGVAWETFWTQVYTRAAGPVLPAQLPGPTTCVRQEYGQFDFWLGNWDLVSPAGQSSGDRSRVALATGDCVVEETFIPTSGGGVSRSMYDGRTGEWARVWVEPGRMLIFVSGGLVGDDMIMSGGTTGTAQFTNRTVWQPRTDGRVRQFTQTSSDNGATWSNSGFDATYVPRGSSTPPPPPSSPPPSGGGGGGSTGWGSLLVVLLSVVWRHYRPGRRRGLQSRGQRTRG